MLRSGVSIWDLAFLMLSHFWLLHQNIHLWQIRKWNYKRSLRSLCHQLQSKPFGPIHTYIPETCSPSTSLTFISAPTSTPPDSHVRPLLMFWGEGITYICPLWPSFWAYIQLYHGLSLEATTSGIATVEPPHSSCAHCSATVTGKAQPRSFYRAALLSREPGPTLSISESADKGESLQYQLMPYRQMYSTALWHNKRAKPLLKSCKDTWRQIFTAPRQGWTLRMWSVKLWLKPSSDFRSRHHESAGM